MRLDHLLSKDSDKLNKLTILGRSFGYSFALSSFEGASDARDCVVVTSLFTENCTEETRKSKTRETLCTHVIKFSSLRSSTEESVESNRIDFPEESLMK